MTTNSNVTSSMISLPKGGGAIGGMGETFTPDPFRGTGNFSMRFYETLCLGRIPIFVDTDCVLPYDFSLDWKQHCVWIDRSEIPFIAEKVADFHAALSPDDFIDLQRGNRELWEERLSTEGFYSHFYEHLGVLNTKTTEA